MGFLKLIPMIMGAAILMLEAYVPFAHAAPARPAASAKVEQGVQLMFVRLDSCVYCRAWEAEIGPGYRQNALGRAAPLLPVNLDGPFPDGLALDRKPWLTPTFILLRDGQELARIEGYPGKDHFYPMLGQLMSEAGLSAH